MLRAAGFLVSMLIVASSCNGSRGTGTATPPAGDARGAGGPRTWPADTPPRDACRADTDCLVLVSGPGGDDPCCDVTLTAGAASKAYVDFVQKYRAASCAGATCPPLTLPGAQPAECAFQPRCVQGRCGNSCTP